VKDPVQQVARRMIFDFLLEDFLKMVVLIDEFVQ
jgi:hypothetical protein